MSYDTLRNQTNLGGNGPFAFTVEIVEGLAKEPSLMDRYLKDSTSYNTLRSQTNLGGNGPAAVTVKVIEGLVKDLL